MSTLTEQVRTSEWLKWFVDRGFTMTTGVIEGNNAVSGAAAALFTGDVLRLSGAKYIAISASTGANAVAVLMEDISLVENTAGDHNALILVRGPARIDSDHLVFTESDTQKAAALTNLATLDIRVGTLTATWTTQSS